MPKSGSRRISPSGTIRMANRVSSLGMDSWRLDQASRCLTIHQAVISTDSGLNSSEGWMLARDRRIHRWAWFIAGKKNTAPSSTRKPVEHLQHPGVVPQGVQVGLAQGQHDGHPDAAAHHLVHQEGGGGAAGT